MPVFRYKAINSSGIEQRGEISAVSATNAENMLRDKGLLVKTLSLKNKISFINKRINTDDFVQFLTEFIALIRAGLTIPEALEQCSNRPGNQYLSTALKNTVNAIKEGVHFSSALEQYPDIFDTLMISSVKTGESAGDLVSPLAGYKAYLERKNSIRKKVTQAMVYPVFILVVMLLILTALFIFVMPRFITLYSDFDTQLPGPTRFLLFLAGNMKFIAPTIAAVLIAAYIFLRATKGEKPVKARLDSLAVKLPYFGGIIRSLEYANISRTLFTLVSGGMQLAEALKTTRSSVKNSFFLEKLEKVIDKVYAGTVFSSAAADEKLLPPTAIKLLEAGEASGTLDAMLGEISGYYEQIADGKITAVMTLIEPTMIFLTGILVGGVIIAMYLPIFRLAEVVK